MLLAVSFALRIGEVGVRGAWGQVFFVTLGNRLGLLALWSFVIPAEAKAIVPKALVALLERRRRKPADSE